MIEFNQKLQRVVTEGEKGEVGSIGNDLIKLREDVALWLENGRK